MARYSLNLSVSADDSLGICPCTASALAFWRDVTIQTNGYDKYKRILADVLLPDGMNPQPGVGQARQLVAVSEVCAWGDGAGRTREGGTRLVS